MALDVRIAIKNSVIKIQFIPVRVCIEFQPNREDGFKENGFDLLISLPLSKRLRGWGVHTVCSSAWPKKDRRFIAGLWFNGVEAGFKQAPFWWS